MGGKKQAALRVFPDPKRGKGLTGERTRPGGWVTPGVRVRLKMGSAGRASGRGTRERIKTEKQTASKDLEAPSERAFGMGIIEREH